jgi:hypothetical protein
MGGVRVAADVARSKRSRGEGDKKKAEEKEEEEEQGGPVSKERLGVLELAARKVEEYEDGKGEIIMFCVMPTIHFLLSLDEASSRFVVYST